MKSSYLVLMRRKLDCIFPKCAWWIQIQWTLVTKPKLERVQSIKIIMIQNICIIKDAILIMQSKIYVLIGEIPWHLENLQNKISTCYPHLSSSMNFSNLPCSDFRLYSVRRHCCFSFGSENGSFTLQKSLSKLTFCKFGFFTCPEALESWFSCDIFSN